MWRAIAEHVCKRGNVPKTRVEALARNRVHPVGRIANQRYAIRDKAIREGEVQRIGETFSLEADITQEAAKCRLQYYSRNVASSIAAHSAARASVSLHTIEDRLPLSGRMASGPCGIKN